MLSRDCWPPIRSNSFRSLRGKKKLFLNCALWSRSPCGHLSSPELKHPLNSIEISKTFLGCRAFRPKKAICMHGTREMLSFFHRCSGSSLRLNRIQQNADRTHSHSTLGSYECHQVEVLSFRHNRNPLNFSGAKIPNIFN